MDDRMARATRKARLLLEDGVHFDGFALGSCRSVQGEVVFHTGMSGYVETLTDPSFRGQILVFAYPLSGNYGVPAGGREADRIQVAGLVVASIAAEEAHPRAPRGLSSWLEVEGIPAISGVFTSSLVSHLRAQGPLRGQLLPDEGAEALFASRSEPTHAITEPPTGGPTRHPSCGGQGEGPKILVIDTGSKASLLQALINRGATPVCIDPASLWEDYLPEVDGILLPNGPGDPRDYGTLVERLRPLLGQAVPILGICLGHQLLALAAGARIYRLPIGHRSHNQPVFDPQSQRAYLTSQNHGYAVDEASLPADWRSRFNNLLDGSVEGLRHRDRPFFTAQFHPEGAAGPGDTAFLFDEFVAAVRDFKAERLRLSQNEAPRPKVRR